MKALTKILCLTCVFQLLVFSTNATNKSVADSLFAIGKYSDAALEYEFIYYTSTDVVTRNNALLCKVNCLKNTGNYTEAIKCMDRIDYNFTNDTLNYSLRYQTSLSAYLAEDFGYAESQLIQLFAFISDSTITFKALPLYALVLNELKRWPESHEKLNAYIKYSKCDNSRTDSLNNKFNSYYISNNLPKLKNADKAIKLSTYLPGTGQLYLGYWGEGAINLTLQLASVTYIGYNIWLKQYFTAVSIGSGLLQKFYAGGIHRVEFLTEKRNYELTRKFNDPIKKDIVSLMCE